MSNDDPQKVRDAAYITVVVNHQVLQRMPLLTRPVTLGRSLDCELWIEDKILSRHHCRLEPALEGDGWVVIDLQSRNGTFVNAQRIERSPLVEGDVITIGRAQIRFHADGYVPPRPAGPHEAVRLPANRDALPRAAESGEHVSRPLPKPAPRDSNADTLAPGDSMAGRPLPFSRPAPRPIVKPAEDER